MSIQVLFGISIIVVLVGTLIGVFIIISNIKALYQHKYNFDRDLFDGKFPKNTTIDDKSVNLIVVEARRFRGSVRMGTGNVYTDDEYLRERESVLKLMMP